MKTAASIALLLLANGLAISQTRTASHEWSATLKVLDDTGQPVPEATVWVSYSLPPSGEQQETWGKIAGTTDTNGIFTAAHTDYSVILGFHAQKAAYYPTSASHFLGFSVADRSVNWSPSQTMILVRIGSPIPMYAKIEEAKIPKENDILGFDLEVGDWIAPFGAGKTADFLLRTHRDITDQNNYSAGLELSFTNPGDGILPVQPPVSGLQSFRTAPESGYEPKRAWRYTNSSQPIASPGYFFRVRTLLDETGKPKSALYGKIRGDFRFYVGTKAPHPGVGFDYYLNPTPNDRNLEFDPGKNLFTGLPFDQLIKEP